jgi:epoxyqueuosine reductase QueG
MDVVFTDVELKTWITKVIQDFCEGPENTLQNKTSERMTRCPVGAITETGHNKRKCRAHLSRTKKYVRTRFGFEGYGCGLCQTGVPCESGVPTGIAGG